MKKITSLFLIAFITFTFFSCSRKTDGDNDEIYTQVSTEDKTDNSYFSSSDPGDTVPRSSYSFDSCEDSGSSIEGADSTEDCDEVALVLFANSS